MLNVRGIIIISIFLTQSKCTICLFRFNVIIIIIVSIHCIQFVENLKISSNEKIKQIRIYSMIFVLYKEIQRIFFIHRLEANKYYVTYKLSRLNIDSISLSKSLRCTKNQVSSSSKQKFPRISVKLLHQTKTEYTLNSTGGGILSIWIPIKLKKFKGMLVIFPLDYNFPIIKTKKEGGK